MKRLVVYFSQTGNTKKVAKQIANCLDSDIDEIIDKNKEGPEANFKKDIIEIKYNKDPSKYDLVVFGSPVWAFGLPPAARTYLKENNLKNTAFFCTCGLFRGLIFHKMKKLSSKPKAKMAVHMKNAENSEKKIKDFCKKLK